MVLTLTDNPFKIALGSLYAKIGSNLGGAQYVLLTTHRQPYACGVSRNRFAYGLNPYSGEAIQEW